MLALAMLMFGVGMFALGRLVGREESMRHTMYYIKHMRSDMSKEDRENFDRIFQEYKDKWYPTERKVK